MNTPDVDMLSTQQQSALAGVLSKNILWELNFKLHRLSDGRYTLTKGYGGFSAAWWQIILFARNTY